MYEARGELLKEAARRIEQDAKDALSGFAHLDRLAFRTKDVGSFLAKANDPANNPPYDHPLREIEDQIGGRVIVYFKDDIPEVRAKLERAFYFVERSVRKPANDAEFGYESEHLICMIPPQAKPDGWEGLEDAPATFEIQLRTVFMHAYAQPQHSLAYKSKVVLSSEVRRRLAWIAASAWGSDHSYNDLIALIAAEVDEAKKEGLSRS
jgi:putative GTP pyrophosphokinase